jgi:5'-3' exonuclease
MIKYNPVVIDGNIFLMAHSSAILGNMEAKDVIYNAQKEDVMYRGRGILIKSMLAMIFKNITDMKKGGLAPTSVCLVWDQRKDGKYHKSNIIDTLESEKGYKGDRGNYVTMDDIKVMSEEIDACQDPATLSGLMKNKLEAHKSLIINEERFHAREFLMKELSKFGIPSFSYPGYEADDLDAIFAEETEKLGGYQIHYSGDSDWSFHLREKDVFWQVNRAKLYRKDVADVRKKFGIREGLPLMEWAELFYSAKGSHNFLQRTLDPSIKRVTKNILDKVLDKDFSDITDLNRFEVQRKCFRLGDFPEAENVRKMHKQILPFSNTGTSQDFKTLLDDLKMGDDQKFFMGRNYDDFVSTITNSIMNQITY